MSENAWLAYALANGASRSKLPALLDRFGTIDRVVTAAQADLVATGLSRAAAEAIRNPDPGQLTQIQQWSALDGHTIVTRADSNYPALLAEIPDAPVLLYVRGNPEALCLPQIAIVGSRNATPGGLDNAMHFARHLSGRGFAIASGLALGIDAAAHQSALENDSITVAVLGSGPDQVYPAAHSKLADAIAVRGALISEYPPGTPPRRANFPQRNRLISGISVGTLVVEAGTRSGALITARFAAEQGREVFAIPGSIHNPVAKGCHRLIQNGAKLVETADDILGEISGILAGMVESIEQNDTGATPQTDPALSPDYQRLLKLMGWDPVTVDLLVKRSGLTADEVSSMLLILELEGRIEPLTGGCFLQREKFSGNERDRA